MDAPVERKFLTDDLAETESLKKTRVHRRKARSLCSTIRRSLLALLCVAVAFQSWLSYKRLEDPHGVHACSGCDKRSNVSLPEYMLVRPLVDKKGGLGGRFDVIATVWIKDELALRNPKKPWEGVLNEYNPRSTTAIFSKAIFEGITLEDKHLGTEVDLQIPLKYLDHYFLRGDDLRASFALVPKSPSLLDYANSLSKANMDNLKLLPIRSYPPGQQPSQQDLIIDSYGISVDLITRRLAERRCKYTNITNLNTRSRLEQSHIITRSFIRVVDATKIYNLEAYDVEHESLKWKKSNCLYPPNDFFQMCERNYETHGNFETKFGYKIPVLDSSGQLMHYNVGWAYGPFMSSAKQAWGPMDLVPIPRHFGECPLDDEGVRGVPLDDEPFVNVTWSVGFSGRTPAKLFFGGILSKATTPPVGLDEKHREEMIYKHQYMHEISQRYIGHRLRNDFRAGRHTVLQFIGSALSTIELILRTRYFDSLKSSAGLSQRGLRFFAFATAINTILSPVLDELLRENLYGSWTSAGFLWSVFSSSYITYALLQVCLNRKIKWNRSGIFKIIPVIVRARPTPDERSSRQFDEKFPWKWVVTILCATAALGSFKPIRDYQFISPLNMSSEIQNLPPLYKLLELVENTIVEPCFVLSCILQLSHNYHSKTFAGTSRSAIWAYLLAELAKFMSFHASFVVGLPLVTPGFLMVEGLVLAARMFELVQSYIYPPVVQTFDISSDTTAINDHEVKANTTGVLVAT